MVCVDAVQTEHLSGSVCYEHARVLEPIGKSALERTYLCHDRRTGAVRNESGCYHAMASGFNGLA